MPPTARSTSIHSITVAGLLGLHLVLAWTARAPGVVTRQDDANYLLLGEALQSFAYRDIFLADAPLHRKYPPGYPILLTALNAVPGEDADVAIAANVLLSTATLGLVYTLVRPVFGPAAALAGLAVSAANVHLIYYAGLAYSEALFAFLTVAALLVFTRGRSRYREIQAGVLAVAAALTRPIGVTLVIGLALAWMVRAVRQARAAPATTPTRGGRLLGVPRPIAYGVLLTAVAALTAGGWMAFSLADPTPHPGYSYAADFAVGSQSAEGGMLGGLPPRILRNLPVYIGSFLPGMLPIPTRTGTFADNLIGTALLLVGVGTGAVALARAGLVAVPLYLAGYFALLAVWPYQELRFLVPLLALLLPIMLGGLRQAARRWGERAAGVVLAVVTVPLFVFALLQDAWFIDRYGACTRGADGLPVGACLTVDQASFFRALAHVREVTPADAVFLSGKPEPLFYYTRRRSVDLRPLVARVAEPWQYLRANGVSWVLMGGLKSVERNEFPEWLEPHCRHLAVVRVFQPRTYLLRILPDSAPPAENACSAIVSFRSANEALGAGDARSPR